MKDLKELETKSGLVKWGSGKRKEHFLIANKSGFEKSLEQIAEKEKIILMDLESFKQ